MASTVGAVFGYAEGRAIKESKDAEAKQLRTAAIARQAAGTQQAYEQRKAGERVAGDAVAAMAAGGGMTDIEQLADVKSVTDYNVLSAMFAAKDEAQRMRYAAEVKNFEGKMAKRVATAKLVTSLATDVSMVALMMPGTPAAGGTAAVGSVGGAGAIGSFSTMGAVGESTVLAGASPVGFGTVLR